MPYFPPHKWWLETVWEEIWVNWQKNNLWFFVNIVTSFDQEKEIENNEKIIYKDEVIWYIKNNITHLVIPSFEIINNFPMYKIWDKKTRLIFKYLKSYLNENQNIRVITHTRFFLPSLFWWLFARKHKLKWIHIEHGSDYVKLSSKLKTNLSIIYDKIFGKWIFKKADKILAISEACKRFINNEFVKREVDVFYRWIDLYDNLIFDKSGDIKVLFIWRLVLLKWVSNLIDVYKKLNIKNELIIVWDWEEKQNLENISAWFNISFLWFKNKEFIIDFLVKNNCILVNPSYMEWMPTTVIEWLLTKNLVVASDVWWTREISNNEDLILFNPNDKIEFEKKLSYALKNFSKLKEKSYNEINNKFSRDKNIINLYNLIK